MVDEPQEGIDEKMGWKGKGIHPIVSEESKNSSNVTTRMRGAGIALNRNIALSRKLDAEPETQYSREAIQDCCSSIRAGRHRRRIVWVSMPHINPWVLLVNATTARRSECRLFTSVAIPILTPPKPQGL